jgi:acyl carrier protein
MNAEEINKKVMEVIAESQGIKIEELSADTNLREDLLFDSLDELELIMNLEDEYGAVFPDNTMQDGNLKTIGDITKFIEEHLNK